MKKKKKSKENQKFYRNSGILGEGGETCKMELGGK
jgi:hypothetical protein